MKKIPKRFKEAVILFNKKKGSSLAASSSFYVIMSIVPLTLLFIRMVGIALGDLGKSEKEIFVLAGGLFPNAAPEMLLQFENVLSGPLF